MKKKKIAYNIFIVEKDGDKFLVTKSGFPPYYGEKKFGEFREWKPYRSKFSAMILNGYIPQINPGWKILYLGAATGTTVSHFSDIFDRGVIYAVEYSAKPFLKLLRLSMERKNIIPLLKDAEKAEEYSGIVEKVDFIYQDVAQKEQIKIFTMNANMFLKSEGSGLITVKARSIDSTSEPEEIFERVLNDLAINYDIISHGTLEPYHKDHIYIHLVKR